MSGTSVRPPVARPWFTVTPVADGVAVVTEPHAHPLLRANVWHLRGRDRDLVVDTGLGVASLREQVPQLFARDPVVVVTHAHLDHAGGAHEFDRVHAHPDEHVDAPAPGSLHGPTCARLLGLAAGGPDLAAYAAALPPWLVDAVPGEDADPARYVLRPAREVVPVRDGDTVDLGDRRLVVLHLPGHSPGSVVLLDERARLLLSGDVLYDLEPGEELLDTITGADVGAYVASLRRLAAVPVDVVLPGHGPVLDGRRCTALVEGYLARRGSP